ncbi:MAG: mechanosensitive ion channel family protein [Limnospira sp. PMC 1291.21]|uniref:Small-conductance mechanosensitive ion channel, MscS-like n=4 Tax=Limnospira TaxID=2596745 RepID=A0A9P1KHE7_9CYAN|nr:MULTISPECIES: mechanosensitive ion channel family protein [Limnospira]EKD08173.1 mechanosensitive ion channel family protein [Arthrospira platensis C1]MDC0837019.1 mechanosensitive ion channel family protein [Limnoraphis robusta]MDY7052699.1 mechanosensitive ion channel family protein [Limnospira fusiformis LS22]QJB25233.1 mechanosensitive ion channel family protein [Limnospira fusiformis SAG 85.79]MDT9176835.1 mechanosensitive ion channel family protein [Limnospira sp. PMC 1238.20]
MDILEILQEELLTNTLSDYLIAFVIIVLGILAIRVIEQMILRRLKLWAVKTNSRLDDALVKIGDRALIPLAYVAIFYVAITNLSLHPILGNLINAIALIFSTFLGVRLVVSLAEYAMRLYWLNRREIETVDRALNALLPAIRTAAWGLGIIFVLDNLGFNISAVVAGLGIGGVAIALASQGVLQDLFSYFSILFDRPFEIGDFIVVGDMAGSVDYVGIKTTRIKSITGEQVVVPNTNLTASRIHNYKRMERRRILFKIGVIYETPQEKLQQIPALIREIIESIENTLFDRAHFSSFGDFSLDFEIVYHVLSSDYAMYMDIQQRINYELKSAFEARDIEFAYPTQVTYFEGMNNPKNSPSREPLRQILNP